MTAKLIGICGKAGSGKDSLALGLQRWLRQSNHDFDVDRFSFAEPLKRMLAVMLDVPYEMLEGVTKESRKWREEVLPTFGKTPRELMLTLGTEWGRDLVHPNVWVLVIAAKVHKMNPDFAIIPDVRFDNEAAWIMGEGGIVIETICTDQNVQSIAAENHRSESGLYKDLISTTIVAEFGDLEGLIYMGKGVVRDAFSI